MAGGPGHNEICKFHKGTSSSTRESHYVVPCWREVPGLVLEMAMRNAMIVVLEISLTNPDRLGNIQAT